LNREKDCSTHPYCSARWIAGARWYAKGRPRRATRNAEIARITGHSLKDVEALLDAHYLGGRIELAEQSALKLESRYGKSA
jgi:hypothetical protein